MSALSNRQHYREIANRYRSIPGEHGLRPWRVYSVVSTWSGDHPGEGTRSDVEEELLENGQPPRVRQVKAEQVALGTGLESGDWMVGPVTPVVGSSWAKLSGGSAVANDSWRIRLVHDETEEDLHCVVVSITSDMTLGVILTIRPRRGGV
jgi:hypothetical protein